MSAPVGPINIAQINKGIKNGFLSAWLVGVGAMSADVVMMFFNLLWYFDLFNNSSCSTLYLDFWFCNDDLFRL